MAKAATAAKLLGKENDRHGLLLCTAALLILTAFFASSARRERQRITALDAEVDALQRQALALGAESQEATFRRGSGCNRRNGEPRRFPTKV
jgi:type II secretory pathway component PulJ